MFIDKIHIIDHSIDNTAEKCAAFLQPRYLPAFATAALIILALTFTLGKSHWSANNNIADDELVAALPVAENLEFFSAMDVLDDLDLLDVLGNPANNAS